MSADTSIVCGSRHPGTGLRCDLFKGHQGFHSTGSDSSTRQLMDKETKPTRPSWDNYFMEVAYVVAKRATCDRKHVGAVIVNDKRIISTGYNGSPAGMPHCDDVGHLLKEIDGRQSCVRTLHAESNALDDAGRKARGGQIYVTVTPCFDCAKRIVNAGITRVTWYEHYESRNTGLVLGLFEEAGVQHYKPTESK